MFIFFCFLHYYIHADDSIIMGTLADILNDELERYPGVKADQDYAIRKVTENFLSGNIKSGMSAEAIAEVMKKPVDNVTKVSIEAAAEDVQVKRGAKTMYSERYKSAEENHDIITMASKVESGKFKANEKVILGTVSSAIAKQIYNLTGIKVDGYKVAIEARQIYHILKDHGKQGLTDKSMANFSDIAKMEYVLNNPDDIRKAGKTQAYTHMVNGRNRTAGTVLYEKNIGTKSYYVVQAVPDTKAKTLYIVTAFIGKEGYKKEAPQLINANSLDVTPKSGSADASIKSITQPSDSVKQKFSTRTTDSNRILLAGALESTVQNETEANKLREYKEKIALIDAKKFTYINYECELEGKHITLQIDIKIACKKQALGTRNPSKKRARPFFQ